MTSSTNTLLGFVDQVGSRLDDHQLRGSRRTCSRSPPIEGSSCSALSNRPGSRRSATATPADGWPRQSDRDDPLLTVAPSIAATQRAMTASPLDIDAIRARFPALNRREHGRRVAYLDGPGGTQVPKAVIDAMNAVLTEGVSNLGGDFGASQLAEETTHRGREAMADFFNADPSEISFGQNMTSITFAVSRALARSWGPGMPSWSRVWTTMRISRLGCGQPRMRSGGSHRPLRRRHRRAGPSSGGRSAR